MKSIIYLLICFSFLVSAQDQNYEKNFKHSYDAFFHQDFLNFRSEKPGMTRVDVYIQVPYKSLQFIKTGQGFTAKYSVVVFVFDESKDNLIVEKTWNETINVIDFAQTTSRLNYNVGFRSFEVKPGNYFFRTVVIDNDSKKEIKSENTFRVREFNPNLDISDILLVTRSEVKNNQIMPNIPRNVTLSIGGLQFFYEIYSTDSSKRNCTVDYEVLDKESKVLYKKSVLKEIVLGKNQIVESLDDLRLDLGTFILRVTLKDENFKTITSLNKSFFSRWVGLPGSITDIDKAISQMVYIATPDELSKLKDSKTNEDKLKNFLEFWKKKDPSPNNEENEVFNEYFRRVAYANDNFSNYIEGWRTDRGMVYIILGAPNNIDRHPFDYDSKPYEIWEYYELNRSFIFLDQTGFGDYRLITPLTSDLFRYRY
ncbi:MAG: GWxTD domain-containing protein [Ignavibacterium sp.]|uniref:GWxTD domain-containing protein n=1 Tax=Ignavibacterium sp. TaxID=2651167 RepID=UPI004049D8CE